MSFTDKAKNKAQDAAGRGKESAGAATGNRDLKAEGRADQDEASVKNAGEHLKDAAKDVKDGFSK